MISPRVIKMAMIETSRNTLYYSLLKYITITRTEVDTAIRDGVNGSVANHIAFILELKKHIPSGFNPPERVYKPKPRQLVLDRVYDNPVRGKNHHKFKNGSCVGKHPLEKYK